MSNKNPSKLKNPYKTLAEIEAEIKNQNSGSTSTNATAKKKRSVFDDDYYYRTKRNYSISLNNRNEIESSLAQVYIKNTGSGSKIDTSKVSKFEAVYNSKSDSYSMVLTEKSGKQRKLVGVSLDHEDVQRLSGKLSSQEISKMKNSSNGHDMSKGLNRDRVTGFARFKQNLYSKNGAYKKIYDVANFCLRKDKPKAGASKNFKGNNRMFRVFGKMKTNARNFIRDGIRKTITQPAQKIAKSLAKPLGSILGKVGAFLLKLLLNPYIGIPLAVVVIVLLFIMFTPSPVYPPSDGLDVLEVENPLMEHINQRYNDWSDVGLDLAEEYGIYFNLVDSFTLAAFNNPSILFADDDEIKKKYPQWDQDYFATNTFLSMLGPLETRTEYYHWTWGDWVVGYTEKPNNYTQTRTYVVQERKWIPSVKTTKKICSLSGYIRWEVSLTSSCPSYATESLESSTIAGYWVQSNQRYYDGRNLLESWWDIKNSNVANTTDGMINTSYYTYTNAPLPTVDKPTCKNCNSELVLNNGFITKTVDYWTVKEWDAIVEEYFNMSPDGTRFKSFFNIPEAKDINYGTVERSFNKFIDSQKYPSSDSARVIDYLDLYFEHFYFQDYVFLTNGIKKTTLEEFTSSLDEIRLTFNEAYGDDIILAGLVSSFTDPTNYVGRLTSRYGVRFIEYTWQFHYAIDLAAPMGTPLIGVRDGGIVVQTYNECPSSGTGFGDKCGPSNYSGVGNIIIVKYPFTTLEGEKYDIFVEYAHLQKDSIMVRIGDVVNRDQVIAKMGSSGSSTGPHIHFVVWALDEQGNKSYMNPSYLIKRKPN